MGMANVDLGMDKMKCPQWLQSKMITPEKYLEML